MPRKLPSLRKPEATAGQPPEALPPDESPDPTRPSSRRGLQVSLKMMLILMAVVAIATAVGGGMMRGVDREFYVVLATAAPVAVLAGAGVLHWIVRRRG